MILGRDICCDYAAAVRREWLVTNALGGYACGTIAGANTRRYHAFLMASLAPPAQRTLLVAKVDVSVEYRGRRYPLTPNEFEGGAIDPRGHVHIESFCVIDGIPTWRYALADALLEQQVFMARGRNASYLRLELKRAAAPARLELKPLVTYRGQHEHGRGARPFAVRPEGAGCRVQAFEGARTFRLGIDAGSFTPVGEWYWNFYHREEAARGLDALEDLYVPGIFAAEIAPGEACAFVASLEEPAQLGSAATAADARPDETPPLAHSAGPDRAAPAATLLAALRAHARQLQTTLPKSAPEWIRALALAADQFLVRRVDSSTVDGASGRAPSSSGRAVSSSVSIIAGYPWFEDWGRDAMISLPGLATVLGRYEIAAGVLRTYAGFVDGGLLPNRFPDSGDIPQYNTADATLWLFHALHDYLSARPDSGLVRELYPTLVAIIQAHVEGTRHGIRVDPADGLLCAGEPGSQVTWMDAKHGDEVFTPRVGKPVEINALWLNALDVTARLAARVRDGGAKRRCEALLERAAAGFRRFWNADRSCLFDVLDVEGGTGADARIRPNQIFAVSLPFSVLSPAEMRSVVDCCARELSMSYGLRSLSPGDPAYIGVYAGDAWRRDSAYHQGTAWSWLLGPYARAHYRAYGNAPLAQSLLEPIAQHLSNACVGSVSEVFDGDAPHSAGGCFAQAWSVAEILRAWIQLERKIRTL
jgi:glycogen debranching enzyme